MYSTFSRRDIVIPIILIENNNFNKKKYIFILLIFKSSNSNLAKKIVTLLDKVQFIDWYRGQNVIVKKPIVYSTSSLWLNFITLQLVNAMSKRILL